MRSFLTVVVLMFLSAVVFSSHAAESAAFPSEPMISIGKDSGISAAAYFQLAHRELRDADRVYDFRNLYTYVELSCPLSPTIHLTGGAGWCRANYDMPNNKEEEGEGGLLWTLGAKANILEHIIRETPPAGKKEVLGLNATVSYTQCMSDFDDQDFDWSEWMVTPAVSYRRSRLDPRSWHPHTVASIGVQAGLTYCNMEGDLGDMDLDEERDFGLMLGCDAVLASNWLIQFNGTFYGAGDNSLRMGALYSF